MQKGKRKEEKLSSLSIKIIAWDLLNIIIMVSKISSAWVSGERNNISNVVHPGGKKKHSFEP